MSWSLNEVEALARKAARGAGYGWGHAEEAGRAVRWLCAQGLDGAEALAELLEQTDGRAYVEICPDMSAEGWQGQGAALCPLITGAALCDGAQGLDDDVALGPVHQPLLLLPFVAMAAQVRGTGLSVHHAQGTLCLGAKGQMDGVPPKLGGPEAVRIAPTFTVRDAATPASRAHCDAAIIKRLNQYAARTYAPATEASRLAGAGAGTTDND